MSRYQEQRADEGIEDNKEILEAFAKNLRSHDETIRHSAKSPEDKHLLSKHPSLFLFLKGPTHPSSLARAERFEERIAKLEKEQEQSKN